MFPRKSGAEGSRLGARPSWQSVTVVLGGLLVLFYGLPLAVLLLTESPATVLDRLGSPAIVSAATTSLLAAVVTTALATVLGVPLAYWLARAETRWTTPITALVVLPLVLPPTVSGLVLLSVVGPTAPLGGPAAALGLPLTRSFAGVVLAQTFVASPFVVVTARAAIHGVDERLEQASRSLGKGQWTTIRRVTLPLAWPGIVAGMTLTFARAVGEFGATLLLAYYPRTMPVQIWVAFQERGVAGAYPVAVILLVLAIGALVVLDALARNPWRP